jgi:uroporphyrinogen-III synthase
VIVQAVTHSTEPDSTGADRHILITRPREDAEPLAARLAERGWASRIEPMLTITLFDGPPLDLDGIQGLLCTSANGVRAVAGRTDRRDLPVFAVGNATANTAGAYGFTDVRSADGDVTALARLVAAQCRPQDGRLFHAAGTAVAGDLSGQLEAQGFTVERQVLYAAATADRLSPETVAALYAGTIDAVLFFSPRTAQTFVRLVQQAGLADRLDAVAALCLSGAVAATVRTVPWRAIRVADRPDQAALLALFDPA